LVVVELLADNGYFVEKMEHRMTLEMGRCYMVADEVLQGKYMEVPGG
jgi:hypothetical protein